MMRKLFFAMLCIALIVVVWEYYRQPQPKKAITTKQVQSKHNVIYGCVDAMQPDNVLTREQLMEAVRQASNNQYPAVYDTANGISIQFYYKPETNRWRCGVDLSE